MWFSSMSLQLLSLYILSLAFVTGRMIMQEERFVKPMVRIILSMQKLQKVQPIYGFFLTPTPLIIIILQDLSSFAPHQQIVHRLCWTHPWKVPQWTFRLFLKIKATILTSLMMIWIFVMSSEICTGVRDPLSKTTCTWWTTSAHSPTQPPSVICTGAKGHPSFQPFHSQLLWGMENRRRESMGG